MDDLNTNGFQEDEKEKDQNEIKNNNSIENEGFYQNSQEGADTLRSSSFYTESCRKPVKKKGMLFQMIIVALVSSIFGGAIVGGALMFVAPAIQPSVKGYFDEMLPGRTSNTAVDSGSYKKVEIVGQTESAVTAIAEKVSPSIVGIRSSFTVRDFFMGEQANKGEGSGIIIKSDGYIMTNYHVIADTVDERTRKVGKGAKIEVFLPSQKDKPYTAEVVGFDVRTDLAVIKIGGTNLPAAELGDSDILKVGELAVAIGNPGGLEYMGSVTVGVVSGLNRTIQSETGKELKLIQTDAAINPGNSGGALVNSKGQVIGVNSIKIAAQGFEGLGFAIPINEAKKITDDLMQFKYVTGRPILGIVPDTRFNEDVAKKYNVPVGVLVAEVSPLSGAYKAGIQVGDIITKFDGKAVKDRTELDELRNKHKVGDVATVEIYRDEAYQTLKVTLSEDKG
jgi:serine protease Do